MSARRDEILATARKLFAEQGYMSTSMRDIADATGLLPGSLYTHFKSKAQLIEEIVAVFYRDQPASKKGNAIQQLEDMLLDGLLSTTLAKA